MEIYLIDLYKVNIFQKKGNKKQNDKAPAVQKEAPKVEEPADKKKDKKTSTTKNLFSQLADDEEENN